MDSNSECLSTLQCVLFWSRPDTLESHPQVLTASYSLGKRGVRDHPAPRRGGRQRKGPRIDRLGTCRLACPTPHCRPPSPPILALNLDRSGGGRSARRTRFWLLRYAPLVLLVPRSWGCTAQKARQAALGPGAEAKRPGYLVRHERWGQVVSESACSSRPVRPRSHVSESKSSPLWCADSIQTALPLGTSARAPSWTIFELSPN